MSVGVVHVVYFMEFAFLFEIVVVHVRQFPC